MTSKAIAMTGTAFPVRPDRYILGKFGNVPHRNFDNIAITYVIFQGPRPVFLFYGRGRGRSRCFRASRKITFITGFGLFLFGKDRGGQKS